MQVLIAISGFCGFCYRIGNTPCTTPFDFLYVISIHVPAWGTTWCEDVKRHVCLFQSTFPRGERQYKNGNFVTYIIFQSTFPRGERQRRTLGRGMNILNFNPRSRVGNDGVLPERLKLKIDFNPRSRVGNDEFSLIRPLEIIISIHVPAWGTTILIQTMIQM